MAIACVPSPFVVTTAQRLPDRKPRGKLVIRFIGSADTDYVLIKVDPRQKQDADASHADFILYSKESVTLKPKLLESMADVSIVIGTGSGSIYFGET